ncbi:hypothetical protein ON010_g4975 [Phytophthora cinnamomi]|nr:hypothetical protein ON010_g4975 [Phytophthora cinnamomi]
MHCIRRSTPSSAAVGARESSSQRALHSNPIFPQLVAYWVFPKLRATSCVEIWSPVRAPSSKLERTYLDERISVDKLKLFHLVVPTCATSHRSTWSQLPTGLSSAIADRHGAQDQDGGVRDQARHAHRQGCEDHAHAQPRAVLPLPTAATNARPPRADTEIDWSTYMQQVELFKGGERDYVNIRGDTGPLVYPAGFLYVFSFLHSVTDEGQNIRRAQYIFLGIYLVMIATVLAIYYRARVLPPVGHRVPVRVQAPALHLHAAHVQRRHRHDAALHRRVSVRAPALALGLRLLQSRRVHQDERAAVRAGALLPAAAVLWNSSHGVVPVHLRGHPDRAGLPVPQAQLVELHEQGLRAQPRVHVQVDAVRNLRTVSDPERDCCDVAVRDELRRHSVLTHAALPVLLVVLPDAAVLALVLGPAAAAQDGGAAEQRVRLQHVPVDYDELAHAAAHQHLPADFDLPEPKVELLALYYGSVTEELAEGATVSSIDEHEVVLSLPKLKLTLAVGFGSSGPVTGEGYGRQVLKGMLKEAGEGIKAGDTMGKIINREYMKDKELKKLVDSLDDQASVSSSSTSLRQRTTTKTVTSTSSTNV